MDGGTVRLTRLLGQSHALDLVLTGRGVSGEEARVMGLANRLAPPGRALVVALELAHQLAALPQAALRHDRASVYEQWNQPVDEALRTEFDHGVASLASGELFDGLDRYASGQWSR
jgi:enoyl-CoA hydratase